MLQRLINDNVHAYTQTHIYSAGSSCPHCSQVTESSSPRGKSRRVPQSGQNSSEPSSRPEASMCADARTWSKRAPIFSARRAEGISQKTRHNYRKIGADMESVLFSSTCRSEHTRSSSVARSRSSVLITSCQKSTYLCQNGRIRPTGQQGTIRVEAANNAVRRKPTFHYRHCIGIIGASRFRPLITAQASGFTKKH